MLLLLLLLDDDLALVVVGTTGDFGARLLVRGALRLQSHRGGGSDLLSVVDATGVLGVSVCE